MSEPLIVVTGGTGFIGTHLVDRLLTDGARVRLFARQLVPPVAHTAADIDVKWGDIGDPIAVADALRGASVVYHLAGCARAWARNAELFDGVNAAGTRHVCDAAREHEVARLIHASTALVEAEGRDDGDTELTPYQRSKRKAERAVLEFVERGGDAVIVRPTRVYGPGPLTQANSVTQLIDLYRRGRFRFRFADGNARGNYVFVTDVVDGILAAAERGRTGVAYALGGTNCTLKEFLAAISSATGRQRIVATIPKTVARVAAAIAEAGGYFGIQPVISRDWVELLARDWPVSSDLARRDLDYSPRDVDEGVRTTVRWLESRRRAASESIQTEWQSA